MHDVCDAVAAMNTCVSLLGDKVRLRVRVVAL